MFSLGNKNEIKDGNEVIKNANKNTPIPSIINPEMFVKGDIDAKNILDIMGKVEGNIKAKVVRIRDKASVIGKINSTYIQIGGDFQGSISSSIIHITPSGVVRGDLKYGIISIAEKAVIDATIKQDVELLKLKEVNDTNGTRDSE